MVLSRLTKITGPGVATDTNWVGNNADFTGITTTATSFNIGVTTIHSTLIEAHNIKSTGIITATGGSFSGNVTAVDGTFTGNVSIAGTLTYEDVTNIDSVGIITAPALDVDDFLDVGSNIKLGNAGVITATSFVGSGAALTGIDATAIKDTSGNVKIQAQASGAIHSGVSTFQDLDVDGHTNLDNVSVAGVSTFASPLDINGDIDVDGHTNLDNVSIAGITTFADTIRVGTGVTVETNGQATYVGIVTASAFKLSDGSNVGGTDSDAQNNTIGGTNAGDSFSGTNAQNNTLFGYNAGTAITTADRNTFFGSFCGHTVTGNNNTFFGYQIGDSTITGSSNIAIGTVDLLKRLTSGSRNIVIGAESGTKLTTTGDNILIGYEAGQEAGIEYSIFLGPQSGKEVTGSGNIGLGLAALQDTTSGTNNIAVGLYAGQSLASGEYNISLGGQAIQYGQNRDFNIGIGQRALRVTTADHNIAIGYQSCWSNGSISGSSNVFLGSNNAQNNLSSGSNNLCLGYNVGQSITTGSNNIVLGSEAEPTSATTSNEITLGDANITKFRVPGIGLDLTSAPPTLANGADNRVVTASSASALNGESGLLFDGTQLQIGGDSGFSGTWGLEVYNTSSNEGTALIGGLQGAQLQIRDLGSSECLKLTANGQASIQSLKASDSMVFYTTPSGGSVTERLYITGDGKIGINLSNPGDYNNDADALVIEAPSGNHSGMTIRSNYAGSGSIYFADGTSTTDAYKGYIVYSQPNDIMYLGTQNATRLQINSSGAFGLAGSNYGSSGQVLTSAGSGSGVQWATPAAATNSPAFQAYRSSTYTATNGSEVVLDFDQERFDTNSCYNPNNGRFTPNVSGNYVFYLTYYWSGTSSNNIKQAHTYIRKNGSDNIGQFWIDPHDSYRDNRLGMSVTCAAPMNGSSDYIEAIGYCLINGGNPYFNAGGASFGGFKLA